MKKVFYVLSTVAMVALFASCGGNSVQKDAEKVAKKACECLKMSTGEDMDVDKVMKCASEMEEMGKEFEAKYTSKEDQDAFEKAGIEAMKKECPEVADMM